MSVVAVLLAPTAAGESAAVSSDHVEDAWIVLASSEDIHVWEGGWTQPVQLTDDSERGLFNGHPAWSPDGLRIAFTTRYLVGYAEGEVHAARIEVMDADGRNREMLVDLTVHGGDPDWSPDGTMIAFSAGDEIQVMSADGSNRRSLGPGHGDAEWSPDGTQIAYTHHFDVWVMDADGSNARNLTDSSSIESKPAWSPDGRYIAYTHVDAYSAIHVLDLETGGPAVAVTDDLFEDRHPVWAPDGDRLAFWHPAWAQAGRDHGEGIYVVDFPGPDPEPQILLPLDGYFDGFNWSRPPARFADVQPGNLFAADVSWLAGEGITKGCNPPFNTRFCPDDPSTRGQAAAFLGRALGYDDDGGGDLFIDDDDSVFETDIDRLGAAGVTKGCNPPLNTMFCPDDFITRGQLAAFLSRALGYTDDGGGDLFVDDDDSVFETDIDRLGAAGVTKGCNPPLNTMFCPTDYVTRAQMAAFLHRALGDN